MSDPYAFCIYTDGNAYKNPGGAGAIAGVLEYPPDTNWKEPEYIFGEGYFSTTNNRMELRAVIKALDWIEQNKRRLDYPQFIIYSDSQYVVDNQHNAFHWRKSKWLNQHGRPIYNHRLWREFLNKREKVSVRILKIKGKSSDITKMVDKYAKKHGANPNNKDLGYMPGSFSKSKTGAGLTQLFPANNQSCTINHFSNKPLSRYEHEVKFDLFSLEEESYVGKYKAYVSDGLVSKLHRGNHFDVVFNDDPKHPMILEIIENIDL